MKESEAKGFIQGKLDCMNKCGVFNKEDNIIDNDCDNCEYCYSQGNFGNQKEAFQMAIQALEKQIPTRPYKKRSYEGIYYMCESCGAYIIADYCVIKPKYCNVCGQKLDWSDVD